MDEDDGRDRDAADQKLPAAAASPRGGSSIVERPNQFPWKLYDMLDTAEQRNEEHVISWIMEGTAFKVHKREVFIEQYMKRQFSQTKYKSFQRQLNLWGFERLQQGPNKGAYYHPLFVRGNRNCCASLHRVRLKGPGSDTRKPPPNSRAATASRATTRASNNNNGGSGVQVAVVNYASSSKLAPGETTPTMVTDGATPNGTPMGAPVFETSLFQRPPDQHVSSLPHIHAASNRTERHRQIAAAAAAFGNSPLTPTGSLSGIGSPLFPTSSADSTNNQAVNDELHQQQQYESSALPPHPEALFDGGQAQYQDHHHHHQEQEVVGSTEASSGERRPSFQLAALISVSEQRRREEEVNFLLSLNPPPNNGDDPPPNNGDDPPPNNGDDPPTRQASV